MQRFEITIDGTAQPSDFATQDEADKAAQASRTANPGKKIVSRPKQDPPKPSPKPKSP